MCCDPVTTQAASHSFHFKTFLLAHVLFFKIMCFIRTYLDMKITLLIFTSLDPSAQHTGHFSILQLQSSLILLYCVCVRV